MKSELLLKTPLSKQQKTSDTLLSSDTKDHSAEERILVRGGRVHNLKNIEVSIPRNCLTVITGPSGSGKSSLAFDTIYAEGQRRYIESLSVYARQFLQQLSKPDVDEILGLSPTISIEQKTTSYNPRSTVGTVTEVYDYLRLLYARVSKPICYKCKQLIHSQSSGQIAELILSFPEKSKLSILAPIVRGRKGEYQKELESLRKQGFVRVRVDGEIQDLSDDIKLHKNKKHDLDVYVDRIVIKEDRNQLSSRVNDSVELALKLGGGNLVLEEIKEGSSSEKLFSQNFACETCEISYPEPEPRLFSFNSPLGACPGCDGLGYLAEEETEDEEKEFIQSDRRGGGKPCTECEGTRLCIEARHFFFQEKSIQNLVQMELSELQRFFKEISLSNRETLIADRVVKEIQDRLHFLNRVGAGYLNLGRMAKTLSGGESQRIRLASQIGSSLVDVIYVLDEPSIGLHPRDHGMLLETLNDLKDLGNTILVVEHDRETIEKADYILDFGPGAGTKGGVVMASGTFEEVLKNPNSLTGRYLSGDIEIPVPKIRRPFDPKNTIQIRGAAQNNLKKVDFDLPLGLFTCVTGVSGSGKSTLIIDTLYPLLMQELYGSEVGDLKIRSHKGIEKIDKVIDIDQSPIGRTPRSNPATYTDLFGPIRTLFSTLPEAQIRGFLPGRFSFNVPGGRCDTCEGDGQKKIEMHFLPDVFVECEICRGRRYQRETLEIYYKGKNIADVLEMTVADALEFFEAVPSIQRKLQTLNDVGLGYLHLGQSSTTLSGGEAQRIKLAKELSKKGTGKTLYILDEPSTGLHFNDILKLIEMLQILVDQGNTVIVIEHNLDIIKVADYVMDLGPGGGKTGGEIVALGTPEEVIRNKKSATGKFLKPYLKG
jgi:excinuclease ABC subunit A